MSTARKIQLVTHSQPRKLIPEAIRQDFPILDQKVKGHPLVYLDNAATTQKPQSVIDKIQHYYQCDNANIHRGVHMLSERATDEYEQARLRVKKFLNAKKVEEIIFVRGTTEAINLVAQTFGRQQIKAGDEIVISHMEHHSNIVPWQMLCEQTGAILKVIPITDEGELILEEYEKLLCEKTKLVSVVHISNSLGTVNPVQEIIQKAHERNIPVLIDGAQAVSHSAVDVQTLDADFYVFSGHKLFGPTGIGVLYGKEKLLASMPPYQGGGDMIRQVSFEKTTYNDLPYKFEAGTPNIVGAIGLGAAIDYLHQFNWSEISRYEHELLDYATEQLNHIEGTRIIGQAQHKVSVISFVMDIAHPHDIGTILDDHGIAIRTGHHCTMPLMKRLSVPATARASMAFYNTKNDIDILIHGLSQVRRMFR